IESNSRVVVGVNEYQTEDTKPMDILKVDRNVEQLQKRRLSDIRKERDSSKANTSLDELRREAGKDTNLTPYVLACIENLVTLGEISDVFRDVFGKYEGGRIV
ncbi:MAG: methylmalonyl-CoA mutase, partial [Methanobacteriota archaeon]